MNDYIKDCVNGCLYRISARNLTLGVYRFDCKGFVGIREKFGSEFLSMEYHWDNGQPFGTVMPLDFLEGCPLTDLRESIGFYDTITNRPVAFDKPVSGGGKGWYYLDTGEASEDIRSVSKGNQELFDWLKEKEKQYNPSPTNGINP